MKTSSTVRPGTVAHFFARALLLAPGWEHSDVLSFIAHLPAEVHQQDARMPYRGSAVGATRWLHRYMQASGQRLTASECTLSLFHHLMKIQEPFAMLPHEHAGLDLPHSYSVLHAAAAMAMLSEGNYTRATVRSLPHVDEAFVRMLSPGVFLRGVTPHDLEAAQHAEVLTACAVHDDAAALIIEATPVGEVVVGLVTWFDNTNLQSCPAWRTVSVGGYQRIPDAVERRLPGAVHQGTVRPEDLFRMTDLLRSVRTAQPERAFPLRALLPDPQERPLPGNWSVFDHPDTVQTYA